MPQRRIEFWARRNRRCPTALTLLLLWLWTLPQQAHAQAQSDVSSAQVQRSIAVAVRALRRIQNDDGTWPQRYVDGGETCLAALALLTAGESPSAPHMAAALRQVEAAPIEATYVVSLKILAMAQADPAKYKPSIARAARWLIDAQQSNGLWSYTSRKQQFDHSNTQFALLGLNAAAEAGVEIPAGVWQRARTGVLGTQNRDGGWSYRTSPESYGSMTAANVCNLIILGERAAGARERGFADGAAPNCGKYPAARPLANGLRWLGVHFDADSHPQRGASWLIYWLYAAERAGMLSGQRFFGANEWYREGARSLLRRQGGTGLWSDSVSETSLAILFLVKGRNPLLIQKLKWSNDDEWNPDRNDVRNLVKFLGDRLGEPVDWQVLPVEAPLEQWLASPILYLQGHSFPNLSAEQSRTLRAYVEQGGTVLAEACCGSEEFRRGFDALAREVFGEQPLRELPADHPVYAAHYSLAPQGLMGIDLGCRTSVFFSPRDLSCLWEQGDLPGLSEPALQLGVNIAAFAIGRRPLRDRLDVVVVPRDDAGDDRPPPGNALQLAQLVYEGDWRPDPHALERLAEALRDRGGVNVVTRARAVRAEVSQLAGAPLLFLTGHAPFLWSVAEVDALRGHLRRGGFVLAEACCGSEAFDRSFREQIGRVLDGAPLRRIPLDHALFGALPGPPLTRVGYKPAVVREGDSGASPELWGAEIGGRLTLVYSPFALGCGLEGHVCHGCRGLTDEDAAALAVRIILHGLSN